MEIIGILFLATLIEGLVEYLFAKEGESRPWLKYVSLVLGIGAAIAYKVDIPGMLGLVADYGVINWVVSGIVIGRGANYVNDIIGAFRKG